MNPLSRIAGLAIDRAIGLTGPAEPVTLKRDVGVPMPDGVVLLGDHYRPARNNAPMPVVLIRSPYGRAGLAGTVFAAPLARRGFQVFVQSTRGTFGSGGQFRPFLHEREDGLATVAWLREQPWCDGRVSMTGASYLGHTQWAIAPYVDPPLESVSLNVTAARITAAFYEHGAPGLRNALGWTGQIGRQERGPHTMVPNPAQLARMRKALKKLPLQAADSDVAGAPVAFWRDFVDHAGPGDDFWAGVDHQNSDLTRLPPVSMVTGWWDLFLPEQLRDYAAIRAAGVEARLTVGPWLHGEPAEIKAITQQDVAWLRRHLTGAPAQSGPPVRLYLQHADRWLEFDHWPPPGLADRPTTCARPGDSRPTASRAIPCRPGLSTTPPTRRRQRAARCCSRPASKSTMLTIEARSDVLTYTTSAFETDKDLVGPVQARIFVRTQTGHADVFVRLCDVDDKGVSRNITDGIRRLVPDEDGIRAVDVELFPTAYRVLAGHRLRLQVSGGSFPRYARNFGTGEPFGTATSGVRCRFEIFADAEHRIVPGPALLSVTRFRMIRWHLGERIDGRKVTDQAQR